MQNIPVELQTKKQALRNNSYFSTLENEVLDELSLGMRLERFERGEVLFWEGDPCAGLYIIRGGSVKLFKTSLHGRELIIRVIEEGTTFNEVPVFDRGQNPVNAAALEESEIWVVEADAIQSAMSRHPGMCRAVVLNLTQNLRMLVGLVEELSFFQVTNRLARLISQLPPDQLTGSTNQRITQDQLAARLGTVREVVARSLRELERSGAIRVSRRGILILDADILQEWAQSPFES
jgi:CRP/FNR family transcriptional regulator